VDRYAPKSARVQIVDASSMSKGSRVLADGGERAAGASHVSALFAWLDRALAADASPVPARH